DGSASWIAPVMNAAQLEPHVLPGQKLLAWQDAEGYLPALREALGGAAAVAFDDEARAAFLMDLVDLAPQTRVRRSGSVTRALRLRKDAAEIDLMLAAGRTVDETIP